MMNIEAPRHRAARTSTTPTSAVVGARGPALKFLRRRRIRPVSHAHVALPAGPRCGRSRTRWMRGPPFDDVDPLDPPDEHARLSNSDRCSLAGSRLADARFDATAVAEVAARSRGVQRIDVVEMAASASSVYGAAAPWASRKCNCAPADRRIRGVARNFSSRSTGATRPRGVVRYSAARCLGGLRCSSVRQLGVPRVDQKGAMMIRSCSSGSVMWDRTRSPPHRQRAETPSSTGVPQRFLRPTGRSAIVATAQLTLRVRNHDAVVPFECERPQATSKIRVREAVTPRRGGVRASALWCGVGASHASLC